MNKFLSTSAACSKCNAIYKGQEKCPLCNGLEEGREGKVYVSRASTIPPRPVPVRRKLDANGVLLIVSGVLMFATYIALLVVALWD